MQRTVVTAGGKSFRLHGGGDSLVESCKRKGRQPCEGPGDSQMDSSQPAFTGSPLACEMAPYRLGLWYRRRKETTALHHRVGLLADRHPLPWAGPA